MSLLGLLTRPATVTHRTPTGQIDAAGEPTMICTTEQTVCELQQTSSAERTANADIQETRWRIYLPATVRLGGSDRVEVAGALYEADGAGATRWNPARRVWGHTEASLRRVV